jgi:hypothetical protein
VALQYVIKNYLHTKIVNYIPNTIYFDESKIPKKFKHKKNVTQLNSNNLYNDFLKLKFLIISNKFPNWTQVKSTKFFKSPRSLIIDILSLEYFVIKSFPWSLNKGNNQWVLRWKMFDGPSITSIVVLMWILKTHIVTTLHKLQKYNMIKSC